MEITTIDIAFVLATVAFFKANLNLKGGTILFSAFLAVLFVAFIPDLVALYPAAAPYVEKIIFIVKLFLTAPGVWDLGTQIGSKIKNLPVG